MGKFFRMSKRYNKKTPADFGLVETDGGLLAVDPDDGSVWEPCLLYDYGWGSEKGYFRHPLPQYEDLLQIILTSLDDEDILGAAAIILDRYTVELLESCEKFFGDEQRSSEAEILSKVFNLQSGLNLSNTVGKKLEDIQEDARRWQVIAKNARHQTSKEKKQGNPFWKFW